MSFLNGLRGLWNYKPELDKRWNLISSAAELEKLFEPDSGVSVIYKHSTSCGVSVFAKSRLEDSLPELNKYTELFYIDVKLNRGLSKLLAEKTGVRHESPQLIVLIDGDVYWHGSHNDVRAETVLELLSEIKE